MRVSYRRNIELGYGMEWNGIVNARSKQSKIIINYYYYYYCFQYLGNGVWVSEVPQVPQPPESHLPVRLHDN